MKQLNKKIKKTHFFNLYFDWNNKNIFIIKEY